MGLSSVILLTAISLFIAGCGGRQAHPIGEQESMNRIGAAAGAAVGAAAGAGAATVVGGALGGATAGAEAAK